MKRRPSLKSLISAKPAEQGASLEDALRRNSRATIMVNSGKSKSKGESQSSRMLFQQKPIARASKNISLSVEILHYVEVHMQPRDSCWFMRLNIQAI